MSKFYQKINFPTLLFLISIIIVLSIFLVFQQWKISKKNEINSLISDGMKFYTPEVIKDLRIDSYMMLKRVVMHSGDRGVVLNDDNYNDDPFVRFLNKKKIFNDLKSVLEDTYPLAKDLKNETAISEPRSGAMLKALYCDVTGYNDLDFNILKLSHFGDGSYDDTHFLLGLLFLKDNKCYKSEKILESIREVVADIVRAQEKDKFFSDLYAERIVFLYWAGYGHYVEWRWINLIRNNFSKDLGWKAYHTDNQSNPHATGLALLSLIYYLEGEPYQYFY